MKKLYMILLMVMIPVASFAISDSISYVWYDPSCPPDKPLAASDVQCFGCEYYGLIYVDDKKQKLKDYLATCSNRELDEYGNSRLKECPSDFPLKDLSFECHSCDELEEVMTTSAEACQVCPNRTAKAIDSEIWSCALSQCPADHPLFARRDCLGCDFAYRLDISKEMCDLCRNRFYKLEGEEVESKEIEAVYGQKREASGVWTDIIGKKKITRVVELGGCYLLPADEEYPIPEISTYEKSEWTYVPAIQESEHLILLGEGGRVIPWGTGSDCGKWCGAAQYFKSCYEKDPISTLPEFCAKCSNRIYKEGLCVFKECPEHSYRGSVGGCFQCGKIESVPATKDECLKCSNRMYSEMKGMCFDCRTTGALDNLTKEECQRCSNRKFVGGLCVLKACPAKTMRTKQGACQEYNELEDIKDTSFDECIKAGKDYFYDSDSNTCRSCRYVKNSEKYSEKCPTYFYSDGPGVECANADTKEECHLAKGCLWRGEHTYEGGTVLTGLRCVTCDEPFDNDFENITKEECDRCPNRAWDEEEKTCFRCVNPANRLDERRCRLCPNKEMKNGICVSKSCPKDTFKNSFGQCISCREFFSFLWHSEKGTEADCAKCPNRFYSDGECYSCDVGGAIVASAKSCAKCPNRIYKNGRCILAECEKDEIHDNEGNCDSCYPSVLNTTLEECNKCPENLFFPEKNACMHCWMTTRKECEEQHENHQFFPEKGLCCNVDFQDSETDVLIAHTEEDSVSLFQ